MVPDAKTPFVATIEARGRKGGQELVTFSADATVSPGTHVAATLTLSGACRNVMCTREGETCLAGICAPRPTFGQPLDAGTGADAGTGHSDGTPGDADARADAAPGDRSAEDVPPGDGGAAEAGPAPKKNGEACTRGTECASGICTESVCCDGACTDVCSSCRNALTASAPDGTCAPIASGKDDVQSRCGAATPSATCGNTGHCDGKGACEKYGSTTTCAAAICAGGNFTPAATCDGHGACGTVTAQSCQGFTCSITGGCATSCTTDVQCTNGYCAGQTCAVRKIDGSACATDNECAHGHCVGSVCCESACTDVCYACAMADTGAATGLCKPIKAMGSSKGRCAVDTATCGHDGTCDGNGACRYASSGVSCGSPSCSAATLTGGPTCNGAGACTSPTGGACPNALVCASATACKTTCAGDADCIAGYYCAGGTCTLKKSTGAACGANTECSAANCRDSICCPTGCTLSCQGCAQTVTGQPNGTCAARSANPATNQLCGSQCVNVLGSDASNCGACGHSCLGGACQSGTCLPQVLMTTTDSIASLIPNTNNVLVFGVSGFDVHLYAVPKTGGTPPPILTLSQTAQTSVGFAAANDSIVMWEAFVGNQSGKSSTVHSCSPANCAGTHVTWFTGHNAAIACDLGTQKCFVQNESSNSVQFATAAAPTTLQSFSPDLKFPYGMLAAAGGFLYGVGVSDPTLRLQVLERVIEDASTPKTRLADRSRDQTNPGPLGGPIMLTSTVAFVLGPPSGGSNNFIYSVPLPLGVGDSPPLLFPGGTGLFLSVYWADDGGVYWFDNTSNQIVTCPVSGCAPAPKPLVDTFDFNVFGFLTGDSQALYFIHDAGGGSSSIVKLAR